MSELSLQGFLVECEREQLHRVQAIQPDGALLGGVEGDPHIRFASANLADWIGIAWEEVLGQPLTALLPDFPPPMPGTTSTVNAENWMHSSTEKRLFRHLFDGAFGSLDGLLSCNEHTWLLELEPSLPAAQQHDAYRPVPHHLYRMPYTEPDWRQQGQALADELRAATGFDRVMIYRFREDGCGEVITESLLSNLSPYLGLRYPASDIPQIARTLYLRNRHRQIANVAASPVAIHSHDDAQVDLTLSDLRAVSPVHLTYLKNMGVTASLSFSLTLYGRLWGLIACHHHAPRNLPLAVRERCAEMAQVFTLAIGGYQNHRRLMEVNGSDHEIVNLLDALQDAEVSSTSTNRHLKRASTTPSQTLGRALLSLVSAEGAALVDDKHIITFGVALDHVQIREQLAWLQNNLVDQVFATDALSALFPPAVEYADRASGLLAVRVGRFTHVGAQSERTFLWWRPEQPRTVYWAGDPRKDVVSFDAEMQHLTPRSSFERWIETSSRHSEPWSDSDLLRAKKFRNLVLRAVNAEVLQ
ncbi:GAF domain-containing protein [Chromatium okenii]|uniref:Histidine kinase n=1 Tax=Chromatium okenii TaxID=61644 RepID=A0A2S7XTI1_9GAMM|nr:GAF domain-containing protein [Chromatium okenii]PQJ96798.1 histidine kinase [Chromatium okenii]